jgi:hypothetical protein
MFEQDEHFSLHRVNSIRDVLELLVAELLYYWIWKLRLSFGHARLRNTIVHYRRSFVSGASTGPTREWETMIRGIHKPFQEVG